MSQRQIAGGPGRSGALANVPKGVLATRNKGSDGGASSKQVSLPTSPSAVAVRTSSQDDGSDAGDEDDEIKMRVLVVGGTGLQGSAVVRQLLALGKFKVVVMTRSTDTAQCAALRERDVTVVKGDMDDPLGLDRTHTHTQLPLPHAASSDRVQFSS